jgi:hypothetical protein
MTIEPEMICMESGLEAYCPTVTMLKEYKAMLYQAAIDFDKERAEVRRLRERERVLVEALSKIAYCYDTGEHTDIARAALEAVKE